MANYKEIVTKAIIAKGKKTFVNESSILVDNNPSTVLGCWIINHNFNGVRRNNQIVIDGSFDININTAVNTGWYATNADFTAKDFIIPIVAAIVIPIFNEILSKPLKQDYGKFRWIVFAYGAVLSFMMGTAVSAFIKTGETAHLIFAIAGASFLLSDIVLSAIYFTPNNRKVTVGRFVINIVTYYIAQYLIAVSPYFIEA